MENSLEIIESFVNLNFTQSFNFQELLILIDFFEYTKEYITKICASSIELKKCSKICDKYKAVTPQS